jgi:hypothetical protein
MPLFDKMCQHALAGFFDRDIVFDHFVSQRFGALNLAHRADFVLAFGFGFGASGAFFVRSTDELLCAFFYFCRQIGVFGKSFAACFEKRFKRNSLGFSQSRCVYAEFTAKMFKLHGSFLL